MSNSLYERFGQPSSATRDATLEPSPRIDDFTKKQYHIPVSSSSEGISSFLAASASSSRSRDEISGRPRAESNGRRRAGPPSLSLETSTPTSPRTSSVRYNNSSSDFTSPTTRTTYDQGSVAISPRRNQPGQVFTTPSNPAKPMMSHSMSNESGLSYLTDSSSADDLLSPQRTPFDGNATSPVSRSGLIGLGELATPRWTAAGSRWAFSPDTEGRNQPPLPYNSPTLQSPRRYQRGTAAHSATSSPYSTSSSAMSAIDHLLGLEEGEAFSDALEDQQNQEQVSPRLALSQRRSQPELSASGAPKLKAPAVGLGFDVPWNSPASIPAASQPEERLPPEPPSATSVDTFSSSQTNSSSSTSRQNRKSTGGDTFGAGKLRTSEEASKSFDLPAAPTLELSNPKGRSPHSSSGSRRQSATASLKSRPNSAHHHSPSHIAHTILKATQGNESLGDEGTAEALRKLDGLGQSPRVKRSNSGRSSMHQETRRSASGSRAGTPAKDEASNKTARSRSRSSTVPAVPPKDVEGETEVPSLQLKPLTLGANFAGSPLSSPRSASSPKHGPRRTSQGRPISASDSLPASTSMSQRGSTSSAISTHFSSNLGSRDSTSMTSMSSPAAGPSSRVSSINKRRGSASSDTSSVTSELAARRLSQDGATAHEDQHVPPVPPLPKDWESYLPSPAGSLPQSSPVTAQKEGSSYFAAQQSQPNQVAFPQAEPAPKSPHRTSQNEASNVAESPTSVRTPTKKWSISGAFSMKPTPLGNVKHSASFNDLLSPQEDQTTELKTSNSSLKNSRQVVSTNDISKLSQNGRSSRTPSVASTSSAGRRVSNAGSISPSQSKHGNMLSPRRTPSGIPFFARRASSNSAKSNNSDSTQFEVVSGSTEQAAIEPKEKDRGGRKSILGLNFLGRNSARKSTVVTSAADEQASNFKPGHAKRESLSSKITSASSSSRKRGKTLPSSAEPPKAESSNLPPMQIAALPQSTSSRIDSLSGQSRPSKAALESDKPPRPPIAPSRSSRFHDPKSALPTIAGSPSVHSNAASKDVGTNGATPTRIPRRQPRSSDSPHSHLSEFGVVEKRSSPSGSSTTQRDHSRRTPSTTATSAPSQSSVLAALARSENQPILAELVAASKRQPFSKRSGSANSISSIPRSQSTARSTEASPVDTTSQRKVVPRVEESPAQTSATSGKSALPRSTRRMSMMTSEPPNQLVPRTPKTSSSTRQTLTERISSSARRSISKPDALAPAATSRRQSEVLASSKSSRSLAAKLSVPASASRMTKSTTTPSLSSLAGTPVSDRSASTSRAQTPVDEEEVKADQEMAAYVRRQQSKQLAAGTSSRDIKKMFEFPGPIPPISGMPAQDALNLYRTDLSDFERTEILDYDRAYYLGQDSDKHMASLSQTTNNYGFDDDRGDYNIIMHDHITFRYEITGTLGKGSFGQVVQCRDHRTGESVAIKIIRNKKRFHHQALIEIKVLENLRTWDPDEKHNVVKMTEHFTFRSHLCIVTELLSINLYELVKANSFHGFTTTLIRRFAVQILQALTLLRHHRVVHCDLKPENILLKHPCKSSIQVIDFGSSCFENEKVYTYIQSRFYRSPEVILGMNYHMAIDMWSLGCILAEMYTGMPLFPGENEQEQLACIIEVLGLPDKYLVDRSSRRKLFFDSTGAPRPVVNSKGRRRKPASKTLAQVIKSDDEQFLDFISKCLIFDPDRRIKAQAALRHPFARQLAARSMTSPAPSSGLTREPRQRTLSTATVASTPRRKSTAVSAATTPSTSTSNIYSNASFTAPVARARYTTGSSLPSTAGSHRHAVR